MGKTQGEKVNEQKDSTSAGLCFIAAGLIAIAGSLLIGVRYNTWTEQLGSLTLLVAGGVLIMGLVRWFKR